MPLLIIFVYKKVIYICHATIPSLLTCFVLAYYIIYIYIYIYIYINTYTYI